MSHFLRRASEPLNWNLSALATLTRFWAGWRGRAARETPAQPIILYEFEGCPFCRVTREAVSALQLSADIRPCPKRGMHFRPQLMRIGGKAQFPYMIDPNTGVKMYESADISRYLYKTYGRRAVPWRLWSVVREVDALLSSLSLLPRLGRGQISDGRTQAVGKPLEFWGVEADPLARLVRETLCTLEIPYRLQTRAPDGGASLALFDPNSGARHTSSAAARRYLVETYGVVARQNALPSER